MSGALPETETHRARSELDRQPEDPAESTNAADFPKYENDLVVSCDPETRTRYLLENSWVIAKSLEMLQQPMVSDDPVMCFRGTGVETRPKRGKLANSMVAEENPIQKSC